MSKQVMDDNSILNVIKNKLVGNEGKINSKILKHNFKNIKVVELKDGDHFLIVTGKLSIPNWNHIEIWKFNKTGDDKFHILEFNNKNLFDVNELMAKLYSTNYIKKEETSPKKSDYQMYNYFNYEYDEGDDDIFYRNSTSVYGYRLPDSFDITK